MARLSRPGQLWLNTKMVYSTMCCAMKDSVEHSSVHGLNV